MVCVHRHLSADDMILPDDFSSNTDARTSSVTASHTVAWRAVRDESLNCPDIAWTINTNATNVNDPAAARTSWVPLNVCTAS